MVELVIYVCIILAPVLKKVTYVPYVVSKSNVLASSFLLMVSSVVCFQKYLGDNHWYEFLCRVMGVFASYLVELLLIQRTVLSGSECPDRKMSLAQKMRPPQGPNLN